MKTKSKKLGKKATRTSNSALIGTLGRYFAVWLAIIVIAIIAVGYQIVRANNNDGLPLASPNGSLARESELDAIELQRETSADKDYDHQQAENAQGDSSGMDNVVETINDAAE